MARSENEDFLQNFRFHVVVIDKGGLPEDPLQSFRSGTAGVDGEAGFQSATIPEITLDSSEYREGVYKWTRKLPGVPTVGDITLMRGVTKRDTKFFDWGIRTATGGDYRVDLAIYQFARSDVDAGVEEHIAAVPTKMYLAYDCFPIRVKAGADLDATSAEISIAELDIAAEKIDVQTKE